jgi:shikimate dehydrogenase
MVPADPASAKIEVMPLAPLESLSAKGRDGAKTPGTATGQPQPQHKKALILGTGGASKAIAYGLKKLGLECKFVSRNLREEMLTYDQLTPEIMDEYKVVVNCTPVGMYPRADEYPNIPYQYLTPNHLLYDLLYNPDTTLFMKKGADKGAITKNGLEMLLLQAFGAWDIWNK